MEFIFGVVFLVVIEQLYEQWEVIWENLCYIFVENVGVVLIVVLNVQEFGISNIFKKNSVFVFIVMKIFVFQL